MGIASGGAGGGGADTVLDRPPPVADVLHCQWKDRGGILSHPVLLYERPPQTVGALYIAPLKSPINDQFYRLDELLDLSGIPVTRWHGDVAMSHKKRLLDRPAGILQITPESLEAMLINRSNDIVRLFGELRFVVIDEIHTLTGTDRGNRLSASLPASGIRRA